VNKSAPFCAVIAAAILFSCGSPKPTTPALTPQTAAALLQYNNKAKDWLTYVKKQNPACEYKLDLPDQTSQPTSIDLDHIVYCAGRPSPKEFDASVSFVYDKAAGRWVITRFAS
jgi:hypothetical protein